MISHLELFNFRNYTKREFDFDKNTTLIVGPNGSGKTNILEAICVLSLGKSPRVYLEQDMINISSEFARLVCVLDNKDKLECAIKRKPNSNRIEKSFMINKARKSASDFIGSYKSVLFAPEDIRLVAGSPSRRRDYLDRILCQSDSLYARNLSKYNRVIKQRNTLLEQIQGQLIHSIHENQLAFWNTQLLETGKYLQAKRTDFFKYSEEVLPAISEKLFAEENYSLKLRYLKSNLTEERLEQVKQKELAYGTTQIGPHRDDFEFLLVNSNELNLKQYGSRGQQRTGVLCLKVLEMEYIQRKTKEKPVLLLDDIFSELDSEYRKAVITITQDHQTVITSADIESVPKSILQSAQIIKLG